MIKLYCIVSGLFLAGLQTGCVSALMMASTGTTLELPVGMPRSEVVAGLGAPKERRSDIAPAARRHFENLGREVAFVEIFDYRGKINDSDEVAAMATVSGMTLGIGEIFMVPLATADIARRSVAKNTIHVFFDASEKRVGFMVNPVPRYRQTSSE